MPLERRTRATLRSAEFGFFLLFASLGVLRANLFIATNEALLDYLGDAAAAAPELDARLSIDKPLRIHWTG